MMPHEPLLDIVRRTIANLEFVERHASPEGPFEVTQLINSFLGALAHPWDALRKELGSITLSDAKHMGWPEIRKELASDSNPKSLGDLVRYMRNGLAHGNIRLISGSGQEIAAIQIWNEAPGAGRNWGATIEINCLRQFLVSFAELAERLHRKIVAPPQSHLLRSAQTA